MTDKQIIIDGVDVSGCVCFSNWHVVMTGQGLVINEIENACTTKQKPCTDIKDCIFKKLTKQLQAKEQECERLKNERTIDLVNQLDQLKAENEVLQKDLATIDAVKDTVKAQYEELKQTLTEIKEMCKEEKGWVNCSDMKLTETAQFAQQIFDKISEVENG